LQELDKHLQKPQQKDKHERNFGPLRYFEVNEDPKRQAEHENVGNNIEDSGAGVQNPSVDTAATSNGKIPVEGNREALKRNGEEHSYHLRDIGDIEPEEEAAHAILLSEETCKKDQHRRLHQRQNRVVQNLYGICPYQALRGIMGRDALGRNADEVSLDNCSRSQQLRVLEDKVGSWGTSYRRS